MKEYIKDRMKLQNRDCMEGMADYPNNYFDLAIVDPPYNLQRFKNGIGKNDRHLIKTNSLHWNNKK